MATPPLRPQDIDEVRPVAVSNEQSVSVHGGLLVYTQDGLELGRVGEFIIDAEGNLTSFVVRAGLAGMETRVWMNWIHSVTKERILLRLSATEVHAANAAAIKASGARRRKQQLGH